jgi:hypothetical protein
MPHNYRACTEVSAQCPVSATTYGYQPSLSGNSFYIAFFSLCLIAQLIIGTRTRTWTYMIALGIGTFGELVGYVGRVLMHFNPWSGTGFKIQICCLVLAPSFVAAAIYLTLKHVVLYYGPEYSRLKPRLYPWVFIGADFGSIVLQAIGGGVASSAGDTDSPKLLKAGDDLIVAGIAFQVATMALCGLLVFDYFLRFQKARRMSGSQSQLEKEVEPPRELPVQTAVQQKVFIGAVVLAYFGVLIRCIYR